MTLEQYNSQILFQREIIDDYKGHILIWFGNIQDISEIGGHYTYVFSYRTPHEWPQIRREQ